MKSFGRVSSVLVVLWMCVCAEEQPSKVVKLKQGSLRGYRDPYYDGLYVFYNIPYATAPAGNDRFKAPLPPPTWTSTREAVEKGVICPQGIPDMVPKEIFENKTMTPDCLIANVYVPETDETNLPVMVTVHGGAYQLGYSNLGEPKNLVQSKKIIAVNFNYRLGAYGFLCLGTPDVPGNAGMKDIVALLRWVRDNIASFGGNPNDVTINGQSAGSSAVDLLLVSKSAKGLFRRAIPESGANVGAWSVQIDPIANAKEYATALGFEKDDDIYELEKFYKTLSFEELVKDSFFGRLDINFLFTPCVERDTGEERFLDDAPFNILKNGNYNKVPMLYGFANMEGLFRVQHNYHAVVKGMNEKFSNFLPHDLQFKTEEEKEEVAKKVKDFYFGDKAIGDDTILSYIDYFSDIMFAYSTLRSVTLQVEAGNDQIFLYEYSFAETDARMPPGVNAQVRGADHCAQTVAVLDAHYFGSDESSLSSEFKKMKEIVREMWLNFVTTGKPVPEGSSLPAWPPTNADRSPHMELTLPPQLRGHLLPARAQLWDEIYQMHYRIPSAPPVPLPRRIEL